MEAEAVRKGPTATPARHIWRYSGRRSAHRNARGRFTERSGLPQRFSGSAFSRGLDCRPILACRTVGRRDCCLNWNRHVVTTCHQSPVDFYILRCDSNEDRNHIRTRVLVTVVTVVIDRKSGHLYCHQYEGSTGDTGDARAFGTAIGGRRDQFASGNVPSPGFSAIERHGSGPLESECRVASRCSGLGRRR